MEVSNLSPTYWIAWTELNFLLLLEWWGWPFCEIWLVAYGMTSPEFPWFNDLTGLAYMMSLSRVHHGIPFFLWLNSHLFKGKPSQIFFCIVVVLLRMLRYSAIHCVTYSAHKKSWDSQALLHVWCYCVGVVIRNLIFMTLMCSYVICGECLLISNPSVHE